MVVLIHSLGCIHPHLFQVIPVILRQLFVSDRPIEPLNEGILLGLPRWNKLDPDVICFGPAPNRGTDILGAIIAAYRRGLATPLNDAIEGTDHTPGRQGEINLHAQYLSVAAINDI